MKKDTVIKQVQNLLKFTGIIDRNVEFKLLQNMLNWINFNISFLICFFFNFFYYHLQSLYPLVDLTSLIRRSSRSSHAHQCNDDQSEHRITTMGVAFRRNNWTIKQKYDFQEADFICHELKKIFFFFCSTEKKVKIV